MPINEDWDYNLKLNRRAIKRSLCSKRLEVMDGLATSREKLRVKAIIV